MGNFDLLSGGSNFLIPSSEQAGLARRTLFVMFSSHVSIMFPSPSTTLPGAPKCILANTKWEQNIISSWANRPGENKRLTPRSPWVDALSDLYYSKIITDWLRPMGQTETLPVVLCLITVGSPYDGPWKTACSCHDLMSCHIPKCHIKTEKANEPYSRGHPKSFLDFFFPPH